MKRICHEYKYGTQNFFFLNVDGTPGMLVHKSGKYKNSIFKNKIPFYCCFFLFIKCGLSFVHYIFIFALLTYGNSDGILLT